MRMSDK